jgi:hypothetical protein
MIHADDARIRLAARSSNYPKIFGFAGLPSDFRNLAGAAGLARR